MRVCVLGHRGMLGHVIRRYFGEQGCDIVTVAERFDARTPLVFINKILAADPQWCINCIGVRPGPATTRNQLFDTNAVLPQMCAETLQGKIRLLHASTDGVFRPDLENRKVNESTDAVDDYGVSKRQAEQAVINAGGTVMRCSIIGPETGTPRSLFGWLLLQTGEVDGYINHSWNGITTLEWAKICHQWISGQLGIAGPILQPGIWPSVSKWELLQKMARCWNLNITVKTTEAQETVARTLAPAPLRPGLEEQLKELKDWY